jgi:hypothetical protein
MISDHPRGVARTPPVDGDRQNLTHIRGEQVAEDLLDVVEHPPALAYRLHDGGEVVVSQNHVGRFFGDLGAGHAHGNPDVGRLQSWRVVDTVSGHGDDLAVGLEGVDDLQRCLLVCREMQFYGPPSAVSLRPIGQSSTWTARSVGPAALACCVAQRRSAPEDAASSRPSEDVAYVVVRVLGCIGVADCYPHQSGWMSAIFMRLPMTWLALIRT